jgi:hypothetical protein
MTYEYARGFETLKKALFEDFKRLIPELSRAFPKNAIIVRPHPVEDQRAYQKIAARHPGVHVTNEGNVVLWLKAARALIHNGCTTGVEAYLMGVPAISYRSTVDDDYDNGFYGLPNRLSHQCFDFEELRGTLTRILAGDLGRPEGEKTRALVDDFLAARRGPLASERIVDILEGAIERHLKSPGPGARDKLRGWFLTARRRTRKRSKRAELRRHRYPGIPMRDLRRRISRFRRILGIEADLDIARIHHEIFRIYSNRQ